MVLVMASEMPQKAQGNQEERDASDLYVFAARHWEG